MNNRKYTEEQIREAQRRKQALIIKKRNKQRRNRYICLQILVFIILCSLIFGLIFIPGNKTLIKGQADNPGTFDSIKDIPAVKKADYSFMIKKLSNDINSSNAILMDLWSGEILAEKFPDEKIYPASLTKIMTAVLVLEHYTDLEIMLEMPDDIYTYLIEQNASVAGFLSGEKVRIIDLLYGILLPSGADACLVVARAISGNEQAFAKKMTEKAHSIGAENTNFVNSTGLHAADHYTTVRDLSTILMYALKNETFKNIFTTASYTTAPTNKHIHGITFTNTTFKAFERAGIENLYVKGGKTGYTEEACLCLASLAEKNGREYILVTVGAGTPTSSRGTQHVADANYIYDKYA